MYGRAVYVVHCQPLGLNGLLSKHDPLQSSCFLGNNFDSLALDETKGVNESLSRRDDRRKNDNRDHKSSGLSL